MLYKIAAPYKDELKQAGIFVQFIILTLAITLVNRGVRTLPKYFPLAKNQNILSMLQIFAIFCLLIAFITINGVPLDWFRLAE